MEKKSVWNEVPAQCKDMKQIPNRYNNVCAAMSKSKQNYVRNMNWWVKEMMLRDVSKG